MRVCGRGEEGAAEALPSRAVATGSADGGTEAPAVGSQTPTRRAERCAAKVVGAFRTAIPARPTALPRSSRYAEVCGVAVPTTG